MRKWGINNIAIREQQIKNDPIIIKIYEFLVLDH